MKLDGSTTRSTMSNKPVAGEVGAREDPMEAVTERIEIADQLSIAKEGTTFAARSVAAASKLGRGTALAKLDKLGLAADVVEGEAAAITLAAQAAGRAGPLVTGVGKVFSALAKVAPIIGVVTTASDVVEMAREKDPEVKKAKLGHTLFCAASTGLALAALVFPLAALSLGLAAGALSFIQLGDMLGNDNRIQGALGKGVANLLGIFKA